MLFETERVVVRRWNSSDLEDLHALYSDPGMSDYIVPSLHLSETKKILEDQLAQYNMISDLGRFVIIENLSGLFIGTFLLRTVIHNNSVEIGYAFKKVYWGKGLATEVVIKSLEFIFETTTYESVYAFTEPGNINSKNVLHKCGFIQQDDIYEDGEWLNSFCITRIS